MSLTRVYLDQRDWIRLARQYYGTSSDNRYADVLAVVTEAATAGLASFPLSAAHYIETWRNRDAGRRQRLGHFMADISKFHTIAGAPDLLGSEVHMAVCETTGLEPTSPPQPFGRGLGHALGPAAREFMDSLPARRRAIARFGQDPMFELYERNALVGPDENLPFEDIQLPTREFCQRQLDMEHETARNLEDWGHSTDRAHRMVLAQETTDVVKLINSEMVRLRTDLRSVVNDKESLTKFVLSLPAKGVITRLRMTAHENRQFRWNLNDLNDITALGTAAAYCDIVVGENLWASILQRNAGHFRARVTSNLLDLPELLISSSIS